MSEENLASPKVIVKGSVAVCITAAVLQYWGQLGTAFTVLMYFGAVSVGILLGCYSVLSSNSKYPVKLRGHPGNKILQDMFKEKLKEYNTVIQSDHHKHQMVFSRNTDAKLDEIVDLIVKFYVLPWFKELVPEYQYFVAVLKEELWLVLVKFKDRYQKMDDVKFLTNDLVKKVHLHLQKVRQATTGSNYERQPFQLSSFLATHESEQDHLRKVSDFLLAILLPSKYALCIPVRHLLREILTCLVFHPMVEMITDPDYINEKLYSYLKWQQTELERHNRTYAYAETYEDFIFMIETCTDVEDLKRMRFIIVSEIMQATTINNLKRAKGINLDREFEPPTMAKGDLLQSRNLCKYIKQLKHAKMLSEKRIKSQGGPDYLSPSDEMDVNFQESIPGKKVLAFSVIMESKLCRKYFGQFLEKEDALYLLGFWEAVEEMSLADKNVWHQLGNEIYQCFINSSSSKLKLPKPILKGIEDFLMANKGPEAFTQAQQEIEKILEQRYYHLFLVSDVYHTLMLETKKSGIDFGRTSEGTKNTSLESQGPIPDAQEHSHMTVSECTNYAKAQLQQLEERLSNKLQALQALRSTLKSDPKMVFALEKETEDMKLEKNQLEGQIERTEAWAENLGKWSATIDGADVVKENDKTVLYFTIMVNSKEKNQQSGWVITKTIPDFYLLQQKLLPAAPSLKKKVTLPPQSKPRFRSYDQPYLEKTKSVLQQFLNHVMEDETLNKCEALYTFFSQSPDHLKQNIPSKKTFKFSLFQLFKSSSASSQQESTEEEDLLFLCDRDMKDDRRDSIAEPLYALIGEIFELQGVFNIVRRTLIAFVQITYGKTINRQLREAVSWTVSEPMMLYFLQMFQDSMWPGGELAKPSPVRSDTQKQKTKDQAKSLLLNNIPELLCNFVGQQNARKGVAKVFEALQDSRLNKQLFYDLLEIFIFEFVPELKS